MNLSGRLAGFSHHGESVDPDLLKWIKGALDQLLGVGPWQVIFPLGLLIVMIPVIMVAIYVMQQRRIRKSKVSDSLAGWLKGSDPP